MSNNNSYHLKIKMNYNSVYFSIIFICCLGIKVNCDRTKDNMYERIEGTACFRRMNGTHQVGCSSNRKGSTGVIHIIDNETELEWVLKADAGPYIPVIPPSFFIPEVLNEFKEHYPDQISGVVLVNVTEFSKSFSNEDQCPNQYSQLEGTCDAKNSWNRNGTNLLHADFPFPIFLVYNITESEKIISCYYKFNDHDRENQKNRALCSLQLNSFMFAAVDTQTCVRRSNYVRNFIHVKVCDSLGDKNIWSTLLPRGNYSIKNSDNTTNEVNDFDKTKEKIIVIAARLDTTSMFDGITPGAVSPVSGLVTLLSTAHILQKMMNKNTSGDNVLFVIFNGESYDYIGSQSLLYDMRLKAFPESSLIPITLEDIKLFIEISQLSYKKNIFAHRLVYSDTNTNNMVKSSIDKLKQYLNDSNINITENSNSRIPPSSLQTFLKANNNTAGYVIADHNEIYTNMYYNSILDNTENLNYLYYNTSKENIVIPQDSVQYLLSNISLAVAKVVYEEINEKPYEGEINDTSELINELLYCYLISSNCKMFDAATYDQHLIDKPLSLYVGVNVYYNALTSFTGYVLAYLTGSKTDRSKENCINDPDYQVFRYLWMNGNNETGQNGVCVQTTMNFSYARSPAFEIENYDWASGEFSSWTESVWQDLSMKMFLKPAARVEIITITVGTTVLALSFIIVYFFNRKSDVLFNTSSNVVGTSC